MSTSGTFRSMTGANDVAAPMKRPAVISAVDVAGELGPHEQLLFPCITNATCGSTRLSTGVVQMPALKVSRAHRHVGVELTVACVKGWAATLIGAELEPLLHAVGDVVYVPEGVVHVAVNLSATEPILAIEARTDPTFAEIETTPEFDELARIRAADLQARFARGELSFGGGQYPVV